MITDPALARATLINDAALWSRPPASRFPIRVAVGDNLFTASDKIWRLVQPAVSPQFRKRALAERLTTMNDLIDDEVAALPYETEIDLDLAMARVALVLAAWVLLGERLERDRADEIARHQREVIGWVGQRISSPLSALPVAFGPRARTMRRDSTVLSEYANEVIARRQTAQRNGGTGEGDVLDALIAARPSGKPLSHTDLTSHVLGLFLAGNETTAASLSWILVHASQHPAEWAKVRDDLTSADNFITETHRLTPAVWGFAHVPSSHRASKADRTIATPTTQATLRRGPDALTTYIRGINRDPDRWEHATSFDPSRHDTASVEQHQSMLTFGLGPRGCIGQHLANAELAAVVPRLAAHADIDIHEPIHSDPAFALRVKDGLTGTLRPPTSNAQDRFTSRDHNR